ncbi:outer membrane lipoprotein carrier protein LolA [Pedobacter changchengzhani]|uniref:Outer membrane lipoprotein carrier protein LolA n=1 Tax=Pedobacter changchengzhani TaxID=2529274 RepID=A0A4R5MMP6_9SPHI|nr:outer membrane lipoprotein carrier protein LolA [Pedobacter changchengzhani]TDG36962.1 outer membrane lipoprotein carrier protein LolA [Pedobacter changchengzhani]
MKKIISILLVTIGFATSVYAQTDAKAKAILADVSKKYKSYNMIKTDFSFTLENPKAKVKETQQGTLYVKANSNKYKVAMTNQDLISDGKSTWTYLKKDKEVTVNNVDNTGDAINPAKIFTVYEKGFKYMYTGEEKVGGKVYQMIDLTPTDIKKSIFKVRLSIDKVAKQIAKVVLFDKNGNKYTYNVKAFTPNAKIPESTFAFDAKKYPGVEVVDLR